MIATAPERPVVEHIESTLQELRKGNLRHGVRFAAVTAFAVLSVLIVLAISLDWYFGWLSVGVRWLISFAVWAMTLSVFAAFTMSVVRLRRHKSELAEQADSVAPIFEERLQTIVGVQSGRVPVDRQMMSQVLSETESLYEQVDPAELAQRHSLRIPLVVIAGCGLLLVGMFTFQMRDTAVLLARFVWSQHDADTHCFDRRTCWSSRCHGRVLDAVNQGGKGKGLQCLDGATPQSKPRRFIVTWKWLEAVKMKFVS